MLHMISVSKQMMTIPQNAQVDLYEVKDVRVTQEVPRAQSPPVLTIGEFNVKSYIGENSEFNVHMEVGEPSHEVAKPSDEVQDEGAMMG